MIELLKLLFSVIIIGISIALITMIAWFVFAMCVSFYRIYIKSRKLN
jgi:hypothetical protein